jgi:hypothetical protein
MIDSIYVRLARELIKVIDGAPDNGVVLAAGGVGTLYPDLRESVKKGDRTAAGKLIPIANALLRKSADPKLAKGLLEDVIDDEERWSSIDYDQAQKLLWPPQ